MNFLQKFRDFIASPSHSRTMGIVIILVLVSAVSLTVIVAQQQQTIKQRAASWTTTCNVDSDCYQAPCIIGTCLSNYTCENSYKTAGSACSTDTISNGVCNDTGSCVASVNPPAADTCTSNGGSCIPMGPCVPPTEMNTSYSCGDNPNGPVCCKVPAATNPPAPDTCTPVGGDCIPMGPCVPPTTQDLNYSCGDNPNGPVCCTTASSAPAPAPASPPSCWTCEPARYDSWKADVWCDDGQSQLTNHSSFSCGETSDVSSACYSAACTTSANTPTDTPTPTPTLTPNLFTCTPQTGSYAGNYQCATITNGSVQCPSGYGSYSPDSPYTGTSCSANQGCCKQGSVAQPNLFACQNQTTGTYAGGYTCADIVNGSTQCPQGYSSYSEPSPYTGTSCGATRGCCKQNPAGPTATPTPTNAVTPTPTLTATPSPTPAPGSTQLALSIFQPRMIGKEVGENNNPVYKNNLPITVVLKSSSGQTTNKSGTVNYSPTEGKFIGTVDLGVIPAGSYEAVVRKGSFLKGFVPVFFIPSVSGATQLLPINTGLVIGLDDDKNYSILYYNQLRSCFGSTIGIPKCSNVQDADLNSDGVVNGIDFNIFIRSLKEIIGR